MSVGWYDMVTRAGTKAQRLEGDYLGLAYAYLHPLFCNTVVSFAIKPTRREVMRLYSPGASAS